MKLIADSGSSKTNWVLCNEISRSFLKTEGINPHFMNEMGLAGVLQKVKDEFKAEITEIHFYGSGVSSEKKSKMIEDALRKSFGGDVEINIYSDFLGACRALFGNNEGYGCILGTGACTGIYDGARIINGVPSMGFWLGDEGSGADLGKRVVKAYLRKEMPQDLIVLFENEFGSFEREVIFKRIGEERPNAFFASFTPFLSSNVKHAWVSTLLKDAFEDFLIHHLLPYDIVDGRKIGFVGSVGYYFQEQIREVICQYFDNELVFLKDPIENLIDFHVTNVQ